jgi:hypothetical protein
MHGRMNGEYVRIWQEVVVADFKTVLWRLCDGVEENSKSISLYVVGICWRTSVRPSIRQLRRLMTFLFVCPRIVPRRRLQTAWFCITLCRDALSRCHFCFCDVVK